MDVVMAVGADYEGLSALSCHEFGPWRLWLPGFAEVGELGDVVGFHLAGALAHLTSSCLEPLDELCAADDVRRRFTVGEDRVALPFQGMPPNVAVNGFLPVRSTVACRHVRRPCGVSMVVL